MAIDQKKANPELAAWLEARQSALKIVKTTKTPSGQTVDWIPIESQVTKGKIASPPPAHVLPARVEDKHRPVKPVSFDLDDLKVERGPAGTVPVVRPNISQLTRTVELKDYLTKKGRRIFSRHRQSRRDVLRLGRVSECLGSQDQHTGWKWRRSFDPAGLAAELRQAGASVARRRLDGRSEPERGHPTPHFHVLHNERLQKGRR
jgi:hypothetical protein